MRVLKKSTSIGIIGGSVGVFLAVMTVLVINIFFESKCSTDPGPNIDWTGCKIIDKDFSGLDLQSANLKGGTFVAVNFRGADLSNSTLEDAQFYKTDMEEVNLQNANLQNSYFEDSNLNFAELYNADTKNMKTKNTKLSCFENEVCKNNEE